MVGVVDNLQGFWASTTFSFPLEMLVAFVFPLEVEKEGGGLVLPLITIDALEGDFRSDGHNFNGSDILKCGGRMR